MMNAIVPLNIQAVRVNANDNSNVAVQFKGKIAVFEKMPTATSGSNTASTGDMIVSPLEDQTNPTNPLGVGVHLHWELPDYFRCGVQPPTGGDIVFPPAPNRWLVIRTLSIYDNTTKQYQAPTTQCFIVESDYVQSAPPNPDPWGIYRPLATVPITTPDNTPYMYMGRVLNYADWKPSSENTADFLPGHTGADGKPLYLTSIGFVGPGFSSYYPECCSVFGFWDTFSDIPSLRSAITTNQPGIQFRASYQVIGWINESGSDPLANMVQEVTTEYNNYLSQCATEHVSTTNTPRDYFLQIAQQNLSWNFTPESITYTLNEDSSIQTLNVPTATLCSGILQEVVWDMLDNTGTTFFLGNPSTPDKRWLWTDNSTELAVGNTTAEALSALLKKDLGNADTDPDVLTNYEYLLDALQLGDLRDLEGQDNKIIYLDESLHSKAFTQISGGTLWIIEQQLVDSSQPPDPDSEITLPLELAEQLNQLNLAQKTYDQARAALDQCRKQLFIDWIRYVKLYINPNLKTHFDIQTISNFIMTSNSGELQEVINQGNITGILQYVQDPISGQVTGINGPNDKSATLAGAVYQQYQAVQTALQSYPDWQVNSTPAPSFWMPTDPVMLMQGDLIQPARRNGLSSTINVRVSEEIVSALNLLYNSVNFSIPANALQNIPTVLSTTPLQSDVQALIAEAYLLIPMLAGTVATALQKQGGTNNPAVASITDFTATLQAAQGGLSPLESTATSNGLYAAIRADGYTVTANPQQTVNSPQNIQFTFTTPASNGWVPDAIAWNAQQALPAFGSTRVDPFLPTYLIWKTNLNPLQWNKSSGGDYTGDYTPNNITQYFSLNSDAVDYQYGMDGNTPVPFVSPNTIPYNGSVTLSQKPVFSLTSQIDAYQKDYPNDPADASLDAIKQYYLQQNILSQALSGFSTEQTLQTYIPAITVQDLIKGGRDSITMAINNAAGATSGDNWYDFGFNNVAPIGTGPLAQGNFGPLRSGFMEVEYLEIVDVFGQRMQLLTDTHTSDGSLQVIPCMNFAPQSTDTINTGKIYLPPRILAPSRLWFRWLSADFTPDVPGIDSDFVETNTHPATSPVCGWILPNHLDNNLFFYDSTGLPIGSFGIEHNQLVYRTRPGNLNNQQDDLSIDIGTPKAPIVNPNLAQFMWYVKGQNAGFLQDWMQAILNSDTFINPANYAQNNGLAVLVGRPLALTRAVLNMETSGNVLPLSQADTDADAPYPSDINNNNYIYKNRMATSGAKLENVQFPVRLGDLANLDDGLVGYLIESGSSDTPYTTLYAPAASGSGKNNVVQPTSTTVQLTLNATTPITLTLLVDPRAGVHATTGVLPVANLQIPMDQYGQAMRSMAMTFFTHPMLQGAQGLVVPLPQESGLAWNWIFPDAEYPISLQANAANQNANWGFTPQTVLEGWLQLSEAPTSTSGTKN